MGTHWTVQTSNQTMNNNPDNIALLYNSQTINDSVYCSRTIISHPEIKIEKAVTNDEYFINLGTVQIRLDEKKLIDLILKAELALRREK